MQMAWGYAPPLIIEAAVRNKVFDALDSGPKTIAETAAATGASERGLRAIMSALVGIELLAKSPDGKFSLTPESAAFLVSTKPSYFGGFIRHTSKHQVIAICTQVAAGLDAIHENGLIHRDLKPGNILMDERGTPYIADFGLAKDHQSEGTVLTRPGQALGSMDYMAPEQIRGEEVTAQSDVYGLGCVMFECMCGRPPFADRDGMRILWAHLQEDPPDPCAARPDVPADVSWALTRALEKEPEKRPPTATAYASMVRIAALGK